MLHVTSLQIFKKLSIRSQKYVANPKIFDDALLNLPQVTVFTCQQQEGFIILKLELLNSGSNCLHCQTYTDNLHQTRPILVRDLPIFAQGVHLHIYHHGDRRSQIFDGGE